MNSATINVAIEIEGDATAADRIAALVEGMPGIFQAVIAERAAQDQQWGGPDHDDSHEPLDWEYLLRTHVSRLTDSNGYAAEDYRQRLVKVIAVAVAAAQSWDRLQTTQIEEA